MLHALGDVIWQKWGMVSEGCNFEVMVILTEKVTFM